MYLMKKSFVLFGLLCAGLVFAQDVPEEDVSQEPLPASVEELDEGQIEPVIIAPDNISFGSEAIFDASSSKIISISNYGNPSYSWDFGDDQGIQFGEKVKYTFTAPGYYEIRLNVRQGQQKESIKKQVLVYTRQSTLIADSSGEQISAVKEEAAKKGIWLQEITVPNDSSDLSTEDVFIQKFQENFDDLEASEVIIFYSSSSRGIQSFAQFWKRLSPEVRFDLTKKLVVQISEDSLDRIAKRTQPVFEILRPEYILLTRPEAISVIFNQKKLDRVLPSLGSRAIEYQRVDAKSRVPIWLPFSRLLSFFSSQGLSQTIIYILLSVPFVTFVIAFFRQFVGVSTFGVFAPLMLALAFLVLGLNFGLIVFLMVMLVSYLIRTLFNRVELLYIPKVALLLSCLALSFFLVLGLAVYFRVSLDLSLAIFPMMMMSTISEKFLSSQSSEGIKSAIIAAVETVLVSLIAYALVDWDLVKDNILAIPELILLPIMGTVWLGRFTGLRVSEYIKFRSLLREDSQE